MRNLIRYTNNDPFFGIFDFDDLFRPTTTRARTLTNRQVRVQDFDEHTEISIAAPGLAQSSFSVDLTNSTLTVGYAATEDDDSYFAKDSYSRAWRVSEATTPEDITATYENGILTVTVVRPEATAASTSIPVN
tara:strand:+ start:580 stop:978 length:399 start_codon:yes stop_codon:yes gene_type:complete